MECFPFLLHRNICCMTVWAALPGRLHMCVRISVFWVWLVIVHASTSRPPEGLLQRPLIGGGCRWERIWFQMNRVGEQRD